MSSHDKTSARRSTNAAPKVSKERPQTQQGIFAGWISEKWRVAWIVSEHRKDKRTGVITPRPPDQVYLLQYETREPGEHRSHAKFQGIAARDHIEAAQKAVEFMKSIGLALTRRTEAALYYNEKRIDLWIGQNENGAKGR